MITTIVIIESSNLDYSLFIEAVKESGYTIEVIWYQNSENALLYLQKVERDNLPALILVELSLLKTCGVDFIRIIKGMPLVKHIPIIAQTTVGGAPQIAEAYLAGANSVYVKERNVLLQLTSIRLILNYWIIMNINATE